MSGKKAMVTTAVIWAWSSHPSMTRQLAARLARELALLPPHKRVDSTAKIAARYGVSNTMAARARELLTGAELIYKSGRHFYNGQPGQAVAQSNQANAPTTPVADKDN